MRVRSRAPCRPTLPEACRSFSTSSGVRYSLERLEALERRRGGGGESGVPRDLSCNAFLLRRCRFQHFLSIPSGVDVQLSACRTNCGFPERRFIGSGDIVAAIPLALRQPTTPADEAAVKAGVDFGRLVSRCRCPEGLPSPWPRLEATNRDLQFAFSDVLCDHISKGCLGHEYRFDPRA